VKQKLTLLDWDGNEVREQRGKAMGNIVVQEEGHESQLD